MEIISAIFACKIVQNRSKTHGQGLEIAQNLRKTAPFT